MMEYFSRGEPCVRPCRNNEISTVVGWELHFYSPQLNPAERWFEALRARLANQRFDTIEDLMDALTQALRPYWEQLDRLAQLTGYGWWINALRNIRTS